MFTIPIQQLQDVRKWFRERGGCVVWQNQDLSSGSVGLEVLSPLRAENGEPYGPPHWAYGNPRAIGPSEIVVTDKTMIEPPLEWFKICPECTVTPGRREIALVAEVRDCSIGEAKHQLQEEQPNRDFGFRDDGTMNCYRCDGTGRMDRKIRCSLKKRYWGMDLKSDARPKQMAKRLSKIHGKEVHFCWQVCGWGLAEISFYTEVISPFTMEDLPCSLPAEPRPSITEIAS